MILHNMQVPDDHSEDPIKEPPEEEVDPTKFIKFEQIQNDSLPGCSAPQEPKKEKERREEEAEKEGEEFCKFLGSTFSTG